MKTATFTGVLLTLMAAMTAPPAAALPPEDGATVCQKEQQSDYERETCYGYYWNPHGDPCVGMTQKTTPKVNGVPQDNWSMTYNETCTRGCVEPNLDDCPHAYSCSGTRVHNVPGGYVEEKCAGYRNGCAGTWSHSGTSTGPQPPSPTDGTSWDEGSETGTYTGNEDGCFNAANTP